MTVLARAPFLAVLAGLVVAMGAEERAGAFGMTLLALFVTAGILLCSFIRERGGQWPLFILVLCLVLSASARITLVLKRPLSCPLHVRAEGTVTEVRPWGRAHVAVLDTPHGGLLLRLPFASLTEGTRLVAEGVSRPLRRSARGKGFDEERFWGAYGVVAWLSPSRLEPTLEQPWNIHRLRFEVSRFLVIHLPDRSGAYLRAAWTGQRDEALNEAHRAWGTAHLLAVSGFHVGIVVICASSLLRRARLRPLWISLLLWGYVLLTGGAPSALRAGLMIQAALLGELLGRPSSSVNSVALAAVCLLCFSPRLFWNVGWRLSVLAALVIAAIHEEGSLKRTWFWLGLSPAVWFATFPQAAYVFEGVPLAGLLLNLFAPGFFTFALPLASLVVLLHLMGLPLVPCLLGAVEGVFILWEKLADLLLGVIPWSVAWGPFLSWCGTGFVFLCLCRAMRLPWLRTLWLMLLGSLTAFLIFL